MAKVNYRKLVESPGFDLLEFLQELAYPEATRTPLIVRVGGKKRFVSRFLTDRNPVDHRESSLKIGFLDVAIVEDQD